MCNYSDALVLYKITKKNEISTEQLINLKISDIGNHLNVSSFNRIKENFQ